MEFAPIDQECIWWCVYNYALGRMTYIVGEVVDLIMKHYDQIPQKTKWLMARDVERALKQDKAGMQCDADDWMDVLRRLKQDE